MVSALTIGLIGLLVVGLGVVLYFGLTMGGGGASGGAAGGGGGGGGGASTLVYVSAGNRPLNLGNATSTYTIPQNQIGTVVAAIAAQAPNSRQATEADLNAAVAAGRALCACGWYKAADGSAASGYPSQPGTNASCGSGAKKLIPCPTTPPPSWTYGGWGLWVVVPLASDAAVAAVKAAGYSGFAGSHINS